MIKALQLVWYVENIMLDFSILYSRILMSLLKVDIVHESSISLFDICCGE